MIFSHDEWPGGTTPPMRQRSGGGSSRPGAIRWGYGPVLIEHEDRDFEGGDDKVKRGFALARDVLAPLVK